MAKIAFLGLGAMGQRMVIYLLKNGHQVTVWNRTPDACEAAVAAGASSADSPRMAAKNTDVVIAMLRDDEASRVVWLDPESGALRGLKPGALAIECSTLSMNWCFELSRQVRQQTARFADAPVLGSRPQAEAGQLIHLLGCEKSDVEVVTNLFAATSSAVKYCGDVGSGMLMKLAANALFAMQVAAFSEIIGLLNRQGMATARVADLLGDLPVSSPVAKGVMASIAAANFAPQFPVDLAYKDIGYVMDAATQVGGSLPVTAATQGLFGRAIAEGNGNSNINALAKLYLD